MQATPQDRIPRLIPPLFLALVLFGGGFLAGVSSQQVLGAQPSPVATEGEAPAVFGVFWEVWDLVTEHYVDQSVVEPTKMTYGAISGMLNALNDDGHTRFLSPKEFEHQQDAFAGRLVGIGIEVSMRDGRITIVAPMPQSPAQRAGLQPGDVIVGVDGTDVSKKDLAEVADLIRGAEGTPVTLTILRMSESRTFDVTVTRAEITVPAVTWALLPGTPIAFAQINQFSERANEELIAAIRDARAAGATKIVLDLRNNPGGLRDEAIDVTGQFIASGVALIQLDAKGERTTFSVEGGGVATDTPLVVLVNEGSASAAEIVAGAVQDHQRAPVVGTKTFGTGTVLSTYTLSDGSAVMLGTARWLTPDGRAIWHEGLEPSIVVEMPDDALPTTPFDLRSMSAEQLHASEDAQLLRAIEILSAS